MRIRPLLPHLTAKALLYLLMAGYTFYQACHWHPRAREQKWFRIAPLACGSAYLLYLAADFMTARSLPLLDK